MRKVRHSIECVHEQAQSTSRILDFTRQRQIEGLERPLEVTAVAVDMARIDQHIVQLEGRQEVLEAQLADLMGSPVDRAIQLDPQGLSLDALATEENILRRALETNHPQAAAG